MPRVNSSQQFVQCIANEICKVAHNYQISPSLVLDAITRAVANKEIAIMKANPDCSAQMAQLVHRTEPVNCMHLSVGIWGPGVEPQKIIYSGNRTIVFWNDGTKTIVKCRKGQEFDEYTGFIAAYAKKMFGSTNRLKKFIPTISQYGKKAGKSDNTKE